jgi:hypothetical protein
MGTIVRGKLSVAAVTVAALLAAVAVACGGGGDDEEAVQSTLVPSPGATGAPTATPSAVEKQLRGMVLQLSDVPGGFSQAQESFSTNEEVAGAGDDAVEVLAQLTEWGRVLGHGVVYSADDTEATGALLVDSTVSLYQSDVGAASSFADAVTTARTTDWSATVGAEATDVQVEEVPSLDVGDEMLWMRITGTAVIGDPAEEQPFIQDVVLFRVGPVRGSVSTVSASADAGLLVEGLVRTQIANMAAGLQ